LGRVAATFLTQAADVTPSTAPLSPTVRYPRLRRATNYLGFAPFFRYLTQRKDHLILESIITLVVLTYLFMSTPLLIIGFLPLDLFLFSIFTPILAFLGSWFFVTLVTEAITRFRYHSAEGFRGLFAATVYAWAPIGLYALALRYGAPFLSIFPWLTFLLLFACITWTLWIYIHAVLHTKRLSLRKAALTTIIITNVALLTTALLLVLMILP
jgi:hypothetical protein